MLTGFMWLRIGSAPSDEILDRTNGKEFHEQRGLCSMEPT